MSENYVVTTENGDGSAVGNQFAITEEGSGIYSTRNALCAAYPGATVHIKDATTGEELKVKVLTNTDDGRRHAVTGGAFLAHVHSS